MKVSNNYIGYAQQNVFRNTDGNQGVGKSAFSDRMNLIVRQSKESGKTQRDSYVSSSTVCIKEMYESDLTDKIELPIKSDRYTIEDASMLEGVPAYRIKDEQTGKRLYIREDEMTIQRDGKTGLEFLINMDQPFSYNVIVTEELRGLLNKLSDDKGFEINETPLQGGLVVNQDPKTGLRYLSINGNEAKGCAVIIMSEEDEKILENLADEFTKYAVSTQRSTAGLYALLEISGNLKREREGFTLLTPNGITYIPYNGNPDKAWEIDMPSHCYGIARKYMTAGNACTDIRTWERLLEGNRINYGDVKKEPFRINVFGGGFTFV